MAMMLQAHVSCSCAGLRPTRPSPLNVIIICVLLCHVVRPTPIKPIGPPLAMKDACRQQASADACWQVAVLLGQRSHDLTKCNRPSTCFLRGRKVQSGDAPLSCSGPLPAAAGLNQVPISLSGDLSHQAGFSQARLLERSLRQQQGTSFEPTGGPASQVAQQEGPGLARGRALLTPLPVLQARR